MTSIPGSRFRGSRLLLLLGVILVAAVSTQCRMVSDSLTRPADSGAELAKKNGGECFKECAQVAKEAMKAEQELHKENQKGCGKNKECKRQEEERHQAAVEAIEEQRQQCQAGCHHQGGGRGGR